MKSLANALTQALKQVTDDKESMRRLASAAEQSLENIAARPATLAIGFFAGFWLGKNYPLVKSRQADEGAASPGEGIHSALAYRLFSEVLTPIVLAAVSRHLQDTPPNQPSS